MLSLGTKRPNNPLRAINNFSECGSCPQNWKVAGYLRRTAQIPYHSIMTYILTHISARSLYASHRGILLGSLFTGWWKLLLAAFECLKVRCYRSGYILIIACIHEEGLFHFYEKQYIVCINLTLCWKRKNENKHREYRSTIFIGKKKIFFRQETNQWNVL